MGANKADIYTVPLVDGVYVKPTGASGLKSNHCLGFAIRGNLTAGSVTVKAKSPGSGVFEAIPNGTIDLTNIRSVLFVFPVYEYQITLSGLSGASSVDLLRITDSNMEL